LKNYQYLPFIKNTACNNTYGDLNNLGNSLISNYPNPYTSSTTITFKTNGGHTLVQIFDVGGRLVMVPVDQDYTQGSYSIVVNTSALAAGVYYARLQNQSVQQVRTMLKVNP
jgi:Secretion system C-terminal sorting domain